MNLIFQMIFIFNKNKFIELNLKFMMINYLPISLWNLHRVIDIGSDSFWPLFSNLMFFNLMAFGLLSLIFYFAK